MENYFTLNGRHFPIAEGSGHETIYSQLPVDRSLLRQGKNSIVLLSDTTHHGIEILAPEMVRSHVHNFKQQVKTAEQLVSDLCQSVTTLRLRYRTTANGFEVFVDGTSAGTFNYDPSGTTNLTIDVAGDGQAHNIVVNDLDDPACTTSAQVTTTNCQAACMLSNLNLNNITGGNPATHTVEVKDFEFEPKDVDTTFLLLLQN